MHHVLGVQRFTAGVVGKQMTKLSGPTGLVVRPAMPRTDLYTNFVGCGALSGWSGLPPKNCFQSADIAAVVFVSKRSACVKTNFATEAIQYGEFKENA